MWDVKPLVNGKDIMSVLQLKAGGPLIREWVSHFFFHFIFGKWGGEGGEFRPRGMVVRAFPKYHLS